MSVIVAAVLGVVALVTTFVFGRRSGQKAERTENDAAVGRHEQKYRAWRVRSDDELVQKIQSETDRAADRLANPPKTEAEALAEIAAAKARK